MVIVDVDNDYCDDLMYGYQIIQQDDGTFGVWLSTGALSGRFVTNNVKTFKEAWDDLYYAVKNLEGFIE